MTEVIAALVDVFSLVGKMLEVIVSQPILLFCLSSSLVPIGIGIFAMLKRAARS